MVFKPKSSLSALDLAAITCELGANLPMRVNGVHALHSRGVSLELYLPGGGLRSLVLDASGFAFLTEASTRRVVDTPFSSACSRLKGLWLKGVEQVDFDRILKLAFSEGYTLVFELVGKGNIILLQDGRVLSAIAYIRVKDRVIEPGSEYLPPPARGADLTQRVELKGEALLPAFVHAYNVPAEVAAEALHRVGVRPDAKPGEVGAELVERVRQACLEIVGEVRSCRLQPNIVYADGEPVDVHPIKFTHQGLRCEPRPSFCAAVAEYYEPALKRLVSEEAVSGLSDKARRLLASAAKTRQSAQEWLSKSEALRRLGDTLSQNIVGFEAALRAARGGSPEQASLSLEGLGVGVVEASGISLTLTFEGVSFRFDPRRSVYENLGLVYEEAKALRRKYEEAMRAAEELERQAKSVGEEIELEKTRLMRVSITHRRWFEKYRWFYTTRGKLVIAGRDAQQNQSIVRRYARKGFTALHADVQGAPLTLLMGEADPQSLVEAAQFAASYSKAWSAGQHAVDVFYADASKVSLQAPSGEYLPKGGVMFHEKGYLKGVVLALCVGFTRLEGGEPRVNAWPALAARPDPCVQITPGEEDKNTVAKKLLKLLVANSGEYSEYARTLRVDEILPLIPGPSKISAGRLPVPGHSPHQV